ncbi:MAG: F-box domain-containing protein, partial [Deltaproteobacteria bacterium]
MVEKMKRVDARCHLQRLPVEVIRRIAGHLGTQDAICLAASCRLAKQAVDLRETWECIGQRETSTVGGMAMALAPRSGRLG